MNDSLELKLTPRDGFSPKRTCIISEKRKFELKHTRKKNTLRFQFIVVYALGRMFFGGSCVFLHHFNVQLDGC